MESGLIQGLECETQGKGFGDQALGSSQTFWKWAVWGGRWWDSGRGLIQRAWQLGGFIWYWVLGVVRYGQEAVVIGVHLWVVGPEGWGLRAGNSEWWCWIGPEFWVCMGSVHGNGEGAASVAQCDWNMGCGAWGLGTQPDHLHSIWAILQERNGTGAWVISGPQGMGLGNWTLRVGDFWWQNWITPKWSVQNRIGM